MEGKRHTPQTYRQKREQHHKLKRRNLQLSAQHSILDNKNASLHERITAIEKEVARFRELNVELAQKVEEELLRRADFVERIELALVQVEELEKSYEIQKQKYVKASSDSRKLERDLEKLTAKRNAFIKYGQRAGGAQAALEARTESIKRSLKKVDGQLKSAQAEGAALDPKEALRERISRLSAKNGKTGDVLYNCLRSIIENIEENEFEGVTYKTRIDKSNSKMGARVYFQNISTQYVDFVEQLRPLVRTLGSRFRSHGIEIKTKARRDSAGIVSAVDVTVVLNLRPGLKNSTQIKKDSRPLHG